MNKPKGYGRAPHIIAAMSIPVTASGKIDFDVFGQDLERTVGYGIEPAILMDTYQINHCTIDDQIRGLEVTQEVMNGRPFTAGVYVEDEIRSDTVRDIIQAYSEKIAQLEELYEAKPIIFQTERLKNADADTVVKVYKGLAETSRGGLKAFELSPVFAPNGWMFPDDALLEILEGDKWIGAKHSSLDPSQEWTLLQKISKIGKKLYTGNDYDFASMIFNGSDALLGIATFMPDKFQELADALKNKDTDQYFDLGNRMEFLGRVAFQTPVPAYKHSAAIVKKMRGWYPTDFILPDNTMSRDEEHRGALKAALENLEIDID